MKNWVIILLLIGVFSCEKISLDETRETGTVQLDSSNVTSTKRKAFLEYYTGHSCGNCPEKGSLVISQLKELYGDDLIVMSIHAGFFARPRPSGDKYTYDFNTEVGTSLDQTFANAGTPKGTVNRKESNGTLIHTPSNWGSLVDEVVNEEAEVSIQGELMTLNTQLNLRCSVQVINALSNDLEVKAYVIEDNIVNWQKDYSLDVQDIEKYTHSNVLRGEFILDKSVLLESENSLSINGSITLGSDWVSDNLFAVVAIANKSKEQILQVEKIAVSN